MRSLLAITALFSCALACSGASTDGGPSPSPEGGAPPISCAPSCDAGRPDAAGPASPASPAADGGAVATSCFSPPDCVCTASGDCEEAVVVPTAAHREGDIDYSDPPPAGGEHNPCWGAFGVHDTPLPAERFVHNLEHGGVALLYDCPDGCADEVAALEMFVMQRSFALLTEYTEMTSRFAAVAWGYRLQTDVLDLDAFEAFYAAHVDQAPESIASPPPASCP